MAKDHLSSQQIFARKPTPIASSEFSLGMAGDSKKGF
jgi:hypothetical protein